MIIIADSGSTKTDWRILDGDKVSQVMTGGYNPYYYDINLLKGFAAEVAKTIDSDLVEAVYYYGSGCSSEANYKKVAEALKTAFSKASCFVYHDLLASARSVLASRHGIACILGTGSNSCLYDGYSVTENVPSVGWMIGDEGSGTYLGKLLITDYMRFMMPANVKQWLEEEYKLDFEEVLNCMYSKPKPNNFFASFPPFISKHIDDEYCHNLIMKNFDDFFEWQISKYTGYNDEELGFVGSIAYHFKDTLLEWGGKNNLNIGSIYKVPMDGLINFHKSK
ncbi:MAG: ATPase [Bacteroidales bacterium]|jgi:glucosamine kinase|nr:ATPase [Bacteroidales bacterium]MDD2204247.1 ATPase [Bacteroidales bacterium]MDD3152911.1 ATPase [Bacteroidales bacterium]MDD3913581.1 ATPase [Bacteroidales bacterium]MDD4633651.1 ATPase [Bacteroidales bacterium]